MNEVLRRFARPAAVPRRVDERCDLCGESMQPDHGHVVELESRRLLCTCRACRLLFVPDGAGAGRYRTVPERYRHQAASPLSPAQWDVAQIPVSTAFFFRNSTMGHLVAFYPSPAGATECLLGPEACEEIAAADPLFAELEPDVEAVLVTRSGTGFASYLVPIDVCYSLVGRIRMRWKGLDGGDEVRREMERFFTELRERSDGVRA